MKRENNEWLFTSAPVPRAVLTLVVPTVISQIIHVVYNLADTFFVGQLGDPNQVAAASLSLPLFILITGMANLFGVGGASLIARCLGMGDGEKARRVSAFCIWSAMGAAFVYGMAILLLKPWILPALGTDEYTFDYCYQYVFWTVTVGALPTVLSAELAHLVRAEGYSAHASFGAMLGGIINIALDPVFIFLLDMKIEGAAVATMLSNCCSVAYFFLLLASKRDSFHISLDPRRYTLGEGIPREVLLVGLPSCVMNLLAVFSNITANRLMSTYRNEAIAGIGIAKKIDSLAFALANGLSQGVLPLIGYNYSAKSFKRMREAIRFTLLLCLGVTLVAAVLLFTCAGPIVRAFIDDEVTVGYGSVFQRIMCITGPFTAITMLIITIFQSVGQKLKPLILSVLRKGGLDIPFMIAMNLALEAEGVAWATPMADCCAMAMSMVLFVPFWRHLKRSELNVVAE